MRAVTAAEMREIDRAAIEEYGIPSLSLMENAGAAVARVADGILKRNPGGVAVFCGRGNNGGDGFVAARHLTAGSHSVDVYMACAGAGLRGDAAINFGRLAGIPVRIFEPPKSDAGQAESAGGGGRSGRTESAGPYAVAIDALLGTGFSGRLKEPIKTFTGRINTLGCPVIAVDVPSGMDASTGEAGPCTVRAAVTVTFGLPKKGFLETSAKDYTGRLVVERIGFPEELLR